MPDHLSAMCVRVHTYRSAIPTQENMQRSVSLPVSRPHHAPARLPCSLRPAGVDPVANRAPRAPSLKSSVILPFLVTSAPAEERSVSPPLPSAPVAPPHPRYRRQRHRHQQMCRRLRLHSVPRPGRLTRCLSRPFRLPTMHQCRLGLIR